MEVWNFFMSNLMSLLFWKLVEEEEEEVEIYSVEFLIFIF